MNLSQWVNKWNGRYADYDGSYGAQCADLFNFYAAEVCGGSNFFVYNGAQEIALNKLTFGGVFDHYGSEILGKAGDVIIWSGSFGSYLGGGYGHVAILVSDEVAGTGIVRVLSQNPGPATIMDLSTNGCIGYLRPKNGVSSPPKAVTGSNQRIVGSGGVNYRKAPEGNGEFIKLFNPGDILDFKGFVRGGDVDGNNIWFVGAHTGGFSHSSGFTDTSTNGLNDLTPKPVEVPKLNSNQRVMIVNGRQRSEPNTTSSITADLESGFVFSIKGYVNGQPVEGNPIWFVGANSGHYVWSGLTNSTSTAGIPDLNVKVAPEPVPTPVSELKVNERKMKVTGNQRSEPNTTSTVTASLEKDFVFTVKGFVRGEVFEGNPVWYVGANSGHYVWSGLTNSTSVEGLADLTVKSVPVPAPNVPVIPAPVLVVTPKLVAELDCVTEVIEAHPDNYAIGGMPADITGVVSHQMGTKGIDTIESSINWFKMGSDARNGRGPSSAHILVSKKRVVQMVSLKNRAYHGGSGGNDFWSIEIDPEMDEETILTTIKVIMEMNRKANKKLNVHLHKELPGAATNCGRDVPIDRLRAIEFNPPKHAAPVDNTKEEIIAALNDLIELIKKLP